MHLAILLGNQRFEFGSNIGLDPTAAADQPTVRLTSGSVKGTDVSSECSARGIDMAGTAAMPIRLQPSQHGRHVPRFADAGALRPNMPDPLVEKIAVAGGLIQTDIILLIKACHVRLFFTSGLSRRQAAT